MKKSNAKLYGGLLAALSVMLVLYGTVFSQDTDESCEQLINRGDYQKAFEVAQSLYSDDSTNADYALMYARFLRQGGNAAVFYNRLSADNGADVYVRAEAQYRLGCMAYAAGKYSDAESYAKNASRLMRTEAYILLYARSAMMAGHEVIASRMLASVSKQDVSIELIRLYAGLSYYKRGDYVHTLEDYSVLAAHAGSPQWLSSCLAVQALCHAKLKHTREAAQVVAVLESGGATYLEQMYIDSVRSSLNAKFEAVAVSAPAGKQSPAEKLKPAEKSKRAFRVQGGIFKEMVNAQSLKSQLDGYFSDVRITPINTNNTTLFRVSAGAFASREKAVAFAHKEFVQRNLPYCIIEE